MRVRLGTGLLTKNAVPSGRLPALCLARESGISVTTGAVQVRPRSPLSDASLRNVLSWSRKIMTTAPSARRYQLGSTSRVLAVVRDRLGNGARTQPAIP